MPRHTRRAPWHLLACALIAAVPLWSRCSYTACLESEGFVHSGGSASLSRGQLAPGRAASLPSRIASRATAVDTEAEAEASLRGVTRAVESEQLPSDIAPEPAVRIEGPAEAAAKAIVAKLGDAPASGCVVVLQGAPSEEKAAVVNILRGEIPKAEVWPIGTFFRAMAFLLFTFAEQTGSSMKEVLSRPEMLAAGIEMIEEMRDGRSIGTLAAEAEGMMAMSSDAGKVAENLPLALEYGHGEVIGFVKSALAKSDGTGVNVLLDGRAETLAYIETPHRFEL